MLALYSLSLIQYYKYELVTKAEKVIDVVCHRKSKAKFSKADNTINLCSNRRHLL